MKRLFSILIAVAACDASASQAPATAAAPAPEPQPVEEAPTPSPVKEATPEPEAPAPKPASFSIIEVKPSAGPLKQQLRLHAKRGADNGQRVVLEMGAPWCPPCKRAKALLKEETFTAALDGVVLLRANSDVWGEELDALGFNAPVIPVYYLLDAQGGPSGEMVRGDRWKSRAQVERGLLAFLTGA